MESLYRKFKDQGLRVLAFPANNFANQEPGTNEDIQAFCKKQDVTFDVFAKVSVKGADQCPLYKFLTEQADSSIAGKVKWNFQKYLVDGEGKVVAKFSPRVQPTADEVIEKLTPLLKPKS